LQVDHLDKRLEAFSKHAKGIGSGLELGRGKFALTVGGEHEGLREMAAGDFDASAGDDGAGGVLDGAGDGLGKQRRWNEKGQQKYRKLQEES
jgi:hypothetical protein